MTCTSNTLLVRINPANFITTSKSVTNKPLNKKFAFDSFDIICKLPHIDPVPYILQLLRSYHFSSLLLSDERLLASAMTCFASIFAQKSCTNEMLVLLLQSAVCTANSAPTKAKCIQLFAALDISSSHRSLLTDFLKDSDERVRSASLRSLRELGLRSNNKSTPTIANFRNDTPSSTTSTEQLTNIEILLYDQAVSALSDDSEQVQLEAMWNIWILANRRKSALVDDAFRKICNMVSSASVRVRAVACGLLGTLEDVTESLLLQSLSKSMLKVKADPKQSSKTSSVSGSVAPSPVVISEVSDSGISTSKISSVAESLSVSSKDGATSDALSPRQHSSIVLATPPSNNDVEVVSNTKFTAKSRLIDSGANGAFVHGLEDEFKEVRDATLASICELSHKSRNFALQSTEFFVDMFNDEIDSLRVNALRSVSRVGKLIYLTEEQLQVVLAMLDDSTKAVRDATRKILVSIRLIGSYSLVLAVQSLVKSALKYYPERDAIFPALAALGANHATFVELQLETLLKIDTRYILREPRVDDLNYLCIAILILNAAKESRNLLEILPKFLRGRHYLWLRRHYPLLVPHVASIVNTLPLNLQLHHQTMSDKKLLGIEIGPKPVSKASSSAGFPTFPDLSKYGTAGKSLTEATLQRNVEMSRQNLISEKAFLERFKAAFDSLSICDFSLQEHLLAARQHVVELNQVLRTETHFECESNFKFYCAYLELLEMLTLDSLVTDYTIQETAYRKTAALHSTWIGQRPSSTKILATACALWRELASHIAAKETYPVYTSIWNIMKQPIILPHKLKRSAATFHLPEAGSVRDYKATVPLDLLLAIELNNVESKNGWCVVVSCENPFFRQNFKIAHAALTWTKPLQLSLHTHISISNQRWEHNKTANLSLEVGKFDDQIDTFIPVAPATHLQIKSRLK